MNITAGVPTLIYHDELNTSLICTSTINDVTWMNVHGDVVVTHNNGNFKQGRLPHLSLLLLGGLPITTPRTDTFSNGLWFCREKGTQRSVHVGLYGRTQGISYVSMQLYL